MSQAWDATPRAATSPFPLSSASHARSVSQARSQSGSDRSVRDQIAGVEPFRDLCRRNAGPGDHWPSERNPYDVEDVDLEHPGQHRPGVEDVRLETEEARSSQRATGGRFTLHLDGEAHLEFDVLAEGVPDGAVLLAGQLDGALDVFGQHLTGEDELEANARDPLGIVGGAVTGEGGTKRRDRVTAAREDVDEIDGQAPGQRPRQQGAR